MLAHWNCCNLVRHARYDNIWTPVGGASRATQLVAEHGEVPVRRERLGAALNLAGRRRKDLLTFLDGPAAASCQDNGGGAVRRAWRMKAKTCATAVQ